MKGALNPGGNEIIQNLWKKKKRYRLRLQVPQISDQMKKENIDDFETEDQRKDDQWEEDFLNSQAQFTTISADNNNKIQPYPVFLSSKPK